MIKRQDGLVIIAVLWICALIMWFALQIGAETRLQGDEEVHVLRRSQAMYLAIGGANEAIAHMGQPIPLEAEATGNEDWQPNGQPHTLKYRYGKTVVTIEKETSKVNVNKADHFQLKAVLERAGLEEGAADNLADVIADFIDEDDLARLNGAEKDQYQQMGLPYPPFNGPLFRLDQMLLIPGIDPNLFFEYGHQAGDSEDGGKDTAQDPLLPGKDSLFQLFTVYGNNELLPVENDSEPIEQENVSWEPGGTYRILSLGKVGSGPPAVLLWLIVRYKPETQAGYEILYRKIL